MPVNPQSHYRGDSEDCLNLKRDISQGCKLGCVTLANMQCSATTWHSKVSGYELHELSEDIELQKNFDPNESTFH